MFASYVGHAHPSLWSLLEALQADEATASTDIKKDARGEPPSKRVKREQRTSTVGARALHATACVTVLNTCHLLETFRQRHLGTSFFK